MYYRLVMHGNSNIKKSVAVCTREIKSRTAMENAAFNKKNNFFSGKLDLQFKNKLVKYYTWTIV